MNTEQVPRPANADADLAAIEGRLPFSVRRAKESVTEKSAGARVMACGQRNPAATREIPACEPLCKEQAQLRTREGQTGAGGEVGKVRSTERNRVTPVEGRGLSLAIGQEEEKTGRLA